MQFQSSIKAFNSDFPIILAAIIWGSAGPFIKYLALPATTLVFLRLAIPIVFLVPILALKKKSIYISKVGALASLLFALRMFLYIIGFTYASISSAVLILYSWPVFMSILAVPILKEKITLKSGAILFLAFCGILLVFFDTKFSLKDEQFLGLFAMLISSIILAFTNLLFRKELEKKSEMEIVYWQNFIGAILFLPFFVINRPFPDLNQIVVGSIYAFLIGLVSFFLFFYSIKRVRIIRVAVLSYAEVVSALVFAYFFFNEMLSTNEIIGAGCIILAGILIRIKGEN